jgi:hypothetical protein
VAYLDGLSFDLAFLVSDISCPFIKDVLKSNHPPQEEWTQGRRKAVAAMKDSLNDLYVGNKNVKGE